MKKVFACFLALGLALSGPALSEEAPGYTSRSRVTTEYFSTASVLQIFDDFSDPARAAVFDETWQEVQALLARIDGALSLSVPGSDVRRFNMLEAGESLSVSRETLDVLSTVSLAYELTDGTYDPTVAPLVDLFSFTPRFSARGYRPERAYDRPVTGGRLPLPDAETVSLLRSLVGFGGIRIEGGSVTKTAPSVTVGGETCRQQLDLGGIGKGYAVDRVMALLREKGYRYGYFSCGGSSVGMLSRATASKGAPEPAQWGVGVQYPRYTEEQEVLVRVFSRDRCLSTSGDYEHAYILDGVRYCHLIDPGTGWPVNMPANGRQRGICSVTVLGGNAAMCDALSTALCVMGAERAIEFMDRPDMADLDYLMILYSDGTGACEIVTDLPEGEYQLLDEERFVLCCETDADGRVRYTGSILAD